MIRCFPPVFDDVLEVDHVLQNPVIFFPLVTMIDGTGVDLPASLKGGGYVSLFSGVSTCC